jgi:glycosyltransferase involved in cell wall biosynthesis
VSTDAVPVGTGLFFYPRGGSAQVARYLSRALRHLGWSVPLVAGSLGERGERTNAETFFRGVDVHPVRYDAAVAAYARGRDPIAEPLPLHPSFEDRPNVPDRVFAAVSPALGDHLVAAWERIVAEAWSEDVPVFHLHHLTPLHEAVMRTRPGRPILTSLHGTETKMLDRIGHLAGLARAFGEDLATMADRAEAGRLPNESELDEPDLRLVLEETRWSSWRYGEHWAARLRAIADRVDRIVVSSPQEQQEAQRLLAIADERIECIPNGVDTERFARRAPTTEERLARWRRWLVDDARGWDDSGRAGSVRYEQADLDSFVDLRTGAVAPVLLFVGRFLDVKRVPLLLRAYAAARARFATPAPLVIWGGFPGEWEGEHPVAVAREIGPEGIFFAGWRGHDDLPDGIACSDVMVGPSIREGFGQVFIEAMACGVPVIVARSGGPISFVNTQSGRPNGWLVEPDDLDGLTNALIESVNDPDARRERGENAYEQIRAAYSWDSLAARFAAVYEGLAGVSRSRR